MKLTIRKETWPLKQPFRISYNTMYDVPVLTVELDDDGVIGRGEGLGVFYHGENIDTMAEQIEAARSSIEAGVTRESLYDILPAGGARCAVDCALWDLESKKAGTDIWALTGIQAKPVTTVYTIGIDAPDKMRENASASSEPMLKIKVDGEAPIEQVTAVREGRPDARLIIDANQAFKLDALHDIASALKVLGVEMIEQPLPAGEDEGLKGFQSPVPLGADESFLTTADVDTVAERYQVANIKLDKTGGLTEALKLAEAARTKGLELMVGCMAGTSLSMAPAFVIAQMCKYVDIDGPLLMAKDRDNAMIYENGLVSTPDPKLWG